MVDRRNYYNLQRGHMDFSKIKVGKKQLLDAVYQDIYSTKRYRKYDKNKILKAILDNDISTCREVSEIFYRTSGIYMRFCNYLAYLYRYDWLATPYLIGEKDEYQESAKNKIMQKFRKILDLLDSFEVKKVFGEIALKVIKQGCYYGYIVDAPEGFALQELDKNYCRSRFTVGTRPVVEFNMKYFDNVFKDVTTRMKILNLLPDDIKKGYMLYKTGKLTADFPGDDNGWYLLDINKTVKFNLNDSDMPLLMSVIPAIIDLEDAQAMDKERMKQRLLKIIIQEMPFDKNGDPVFDIDEVEVMHNNAVNMVGDVAGVDVLTSFAKVKVEDMADNNSTTTVDDLQKIERTVYNEAGISQNQFNTDGNVALQKSILNDEATMFNLVLQMESFLNLLIAPYAKVNNKINFKVQLLTTTIYNYQDLSKMYKEGMQIGFSKMLPQIALGISQSSILANAYFENDVLDLINVFIPPLMSSTMNAEALAMTGNKTAQQVDNGTAGRPEKSDDEKSEKTLANRESMS